MSYNVDSIEIVASKDFGLPLERLEDMRSRVPESKRPGNCFLDPDWLRTKFTGEPDAYIFAGLVKVRRLWWSSEWSGRSWETFLGLLAEFDGSADIVVTWEGGDSFTGYRLADHVVTEHRVVMTLGEEVE